MNLPKSSAFTAFFFSAALLFPVKLARACFFFPEPETYRIALFQERMSHDPLLGIFGYARWDRARMDYYDPYSQELYLQAGIPADLDEQKNLQEWAAALGGQCTVGDIRDLLYGEEPAKFLKYLRDGNWAARFPRNGFAKALAQKNNRALRDYLQLAKDVEVLGLREKDPWEEAFEEEIEEEIEAKKQLLGSALKGLKKAKTPFLKNRFAFQAVRLHFFLGDYVSCLKLYQERFLPGNYRHFAGGWASHFASGAALQLGDKARANYFAALSFDVSANRMEGALRQFDADPALYAPTIDLTKNTAERMVVEAMYALGNPWRGNVSIDRFLTIAPESRYLPILLVREVNKVEDWLLTPTVGHFSPSFGPGEDLLPDGFPAKAPSEDDGLAQQRERYFEDLDYTVELRELLEKHAHKVLETNNGPYLTLAIAHLCLMEKKVDQARSWLKKTKPGQDVRLRFQLLLEEVLCDAHERLEDPKVLAHLAVSLQKLESMLSENPDGQTVFKNLLAYFSEKFKTAGNKPLAYLFDHKAQVIGNEWFGYSEYAHIEWLNRHADPGDVGILIAFFEEKNSSNPPLVNYLLPKDFQVNILRELQGTLLFRSEDYRGAMEAWKKLPDDYWETANDGKFASYLQLDPFSVFWGRGTSFFPKNGKKGVAEGMIRQQENIAGNGPDKHKSHLALGHAYLNTGFYGHSWMVCAYGKSEWESCAFNDRYSYGDFYPNCEKTGHLYYSMDRARTEFEKAFSTAPPQDAETRAEAAYMLHYLDFIDGNGLPDWWLDEQKSILEFESRWLQIFSKNGLNTSFAENLSRCLGR
jgi:hypothetical protein